MSIELFIVMGDISIYKIYLIKKKKTLLPHINLGAFLCFGALGHGVGFGPALQTH